MWTPSPGAPRFCVLPSGHACFSPLNHLKGGWCHRGPSHGPEVVLPSGCRTSSSAQPRHVASVFSASAFRLHIHPWCCLEPPCYLQGPVRSHSKHGGLALQSFIQKSPLASFREWICFMTINFLKMSRAVDSWLCHRLPLLDSSEQVWANLASVDVLQPLEACICALNCPLWRPETFSHRIDS